MNAVVSELKAKKYDVAILSAAASDWGPVDRKMEKIPSTKASGSSNSKHSQR